MKLNLGPGTHYAAGWTNVDIHRDDAAGIKPDLVGDITAGLDYEDATVDLIYAGHMVEHISIRPNCDGDIPFDLAMREIKRLLKPSGSASFVCPDVYKAIDWYKTGKGDWGLVEACLEGPDAGHDLETAWDGVFHAWNCHAQRLLGLVQRTFPHAIEIPLSSSFLDPFPVVSKVGWQCAVYVPAVGLCA